MGYLNNENSEKISKSYLNEKDDLWFVGSKLLACKITDIVTFDRIYTYDSVHLVFPLYLSLLLRDIQHIFNHNS